jgi:hypothetical protein
MEAVASRDKKKTVNTETMDRKNEEEVKQKKGKRSRTEERINGKKKEDNKEMKKKTEIGRSNIVLKTE